MSGIVRKRVACIGILIFTRMTYAQSVQASSASVAPVSIAFVIIILLVLIFFYWNHKLHQDVNKHVKLQAASEERLQLIFEYSPDAVLIIEKDGRLISANSKACESIRLDKKLLQKKTMRDLIVPEQREEIFNKLSECFSGKHCELEGILQTVDGHFFHSEMVGRIIPLDDREVFQLHIRDITIRKEAEDRMHAAREMAEDSKNIAIKAHKVSEEASREKSEFLANMSREIRTPLNDIIGLSGLLSGKNITPEQKSYVKTIQHSSAGLLKIVNHVMDIAKMEAQQMDVQHEVIDLWEICKKLQQQFQPIADEKEIKLICRCDEKVPLYLMGDGDLVEQVLEELVENSLRNTWEGMVALNIECHSVSPSGTGIFFQVVDTGAGISPEKKATLFEKKIEVKGANRLFGGLGLPICKQQVELMGGVIGLKTKVGQGSDFHFSLSLPQAMDQGAIKRVENNRSKSVRQKDTRVLLVEDNKVNQRVGVALLEKIGCQVDAVDNGKFAVQKIRKEEFDLVLMDCEMPVLDGFETTAEIRSMEKPGCNVPIIAITANAMKDDEKRCIDAGMDDYISKPVSREALVKIINKHTLKA